MVEHDRAFHPRLRASVVRVLELDWIAADIVALSCLFAATEIFEIPDRLRPRLHCRCGLVLQPCLALSQRLDSGPQGSASGYREPLTHQRPCSVARSVAKVKATPWAAGLVDKRGSEPFYDGRYWARTSDPQLVELVLSQLS
jgi:hypothetical protein